MMRRIVNLANRARPVTVLAALATALLGCGSDASTTRGGPGSPLPGLSSREQGRFAAGLALFDKVFTPAEGLGPAFNENQCSACHTVPATGGTTGFERVIKATRFTPPDRCDLLADAGGENVRKQATPLLRARGVEREAIPSRAGDTGRVLPPALFGLGLVEAIPAAAIAQHADPDDVDGDGISGRPGRTADGRLARFGRKAEFATIQEFIEGALRLEMGLTTPRRPHEPPVNGRPVPAGTDPARDPEVSQTVVDLLTSFVRFLDAPAPAPPRSRAHRDTLARGEALFGSLGCAACHTPALRTGDHTVPALAQREVRLYSDLLLHDMGPGLADVCGPVATPAEVRTEPLMGLRHRTRFLHDGRTSDLREAILAHGGEAERARRSFTRLPWLRQEQLVIFLRSL
ncbi:MAG: di-heme oxidoredictase family protein [Gemmatimonadales bacterium]